jgi:hypothetical protein
MSYALLFLRSPTREKYLRWIAAEFPRYLEAYQEAYSEGAYLQGRYRQRMRDTMERLRVAYGLENAFETGGAAARLPRPPEQLALWA